VQRDAPRAKLCEPLHALPGVKARPRAFPERISSRVADRPEPDVKRCSGRGVSSRAVG
jgi:hypothetical protein